MSRLLKKLNKLQFRDIKNLMLFLLLIPMGTIFRKINTDIWLVSERPDEARDNGYFLFKYIHENKLHKNTFYVIERNSEDLNKVKDIQPRRVVSHGSFFHYLIYIASKTHISAHVGGGMINPRVTKRLEKMKLLRNKKIFLQHGITKDIIPWAFQGNSNIDYFCCCSEIEKEFVNKNFGYNNEQLQITGLCRYDNLMTSTVKKQILVMPTWRLYLKDVQNNFLESEYYNAYQNLINNNDLQRLLEVNNYELVFYPHSEMQPFLSHFNSVNKNIILADKKKYDIQTLLNESALLITDYSSVFFDFAYMKKPCIYYQFDYENFRKGHWEEGYFDFKSDAFGPVLDNETELIKKLDKYFDGNFQLEREYIDKVDNFFKYFDKENCKRVFELVQSV